MTRVVGNFRACMNPCRSLTKEKEGLRNVENRVRIIWPEHQRMIFIVAQEDCSSTRIRSMDGES
jgi:hypothetical protein